MTYKTYNINQMYDFIIESASQCCFDKNDDINKNELELMRSFFTTFCFLFCIDADTSISDDMLTEIYKYMNLCRYIDYDDFENYMLEFIV